MHHKDKNMQQYGTMQKNEYTVIFIDQMIRLFLQMVMALQSLVLNLAMMLEMVMGLMTDSFKVIAMSKKLFREESK